MKNAMSTSNVNRRDFLKWTSLGVMSSLVFFDRAWAQDQKFIVSRNKFWQSSGYRKAGH